MTDAEKRGLDSDEIRRRLAAIRSTRRNGYVCVLGPVILIAVLVAVNRITNGALHVLVSGEPWTRVFWIALMGILAFGCVLLLFTVGRQCPRCGNGFFVNKFRRHAARHANDRGGINLFANRCKNCGLALAAGE